MIWFLAGLETAAYIANAHEACLSESKTYECITAQVGDLDLGTFLGLEPADSPSEITEEITRALTKAASNNPFAGTIKDPVLRSRAKVAAGKMEANTKRILERGPIPYDSKAEWKNLFCASIRRTKELGSINEGFEEQDHESEREKTSRKRRRGRY